MQAWITSMQKQVNEFLEGLLFLLFLPLNRTPWCIGIREPTLSVQHISACRFWLKTLNGEADMLPSLEALTSPVWRSVPRSHTVFWMHQLAQSAVPTPSALHPILISHWESCKRDTINFWHKNEGANSFARSSILTTCWLILCFFIYFSGLCSNFGSLLSVTSIHLYAQAPLTKRFISINFTVRTKFNNQPLFNFYQMIPKSLLWGIKMLIMQSWLFQAL